MFKTLLKSKLVSNFVPSRHFAVIAKNSPTAGPSQVKPQIIAFLMFFSNKPFLFRHLPSFLFFFVGLFICFFF